MSLIGFLVALNSVSCRQLALQVHIAAQRKRDQVEPPERTVSRSEVRKVWVWSYSLWSTCSCLLRSVHFAKNVYGGARHRAALGFGSVDLQQAAQPHESEDCATLGTIGCRTHKKGSPKICKTIKLHVLFRRIFKLGLKQGFAC